MIARDEILTHLGRAISDMEERIERQTALIEELAESGQDSIQATRTLRALSTTLKLMREHQEILISIETRRRFLEMPASATTG